MNNGERSKKVQYDNLVIATGGQPRSLSPLEGSNLRNVFVLRTLTDANNIFKAAKGEKAKYTRSFNAICPCKPIVVMFS